MTHAAEYTSPCTPLFVRFFDFDLHLVSRAAVRTLF